MKQLTYPLAGAFAVGACALLVACGGGGGGGGGTPATIAPSPTPSVAPTAQSATLTATTGATSVPFGGVSSGGSNVISSAIVGLPAFSGSTNVALGLQATNPTSVTPAIRNMVGRKVIGGTITNVLAYFTIEVNPSVTITSTASFSLVFPTAVTGNAYAAVLNNTTGGTWSVVAGPVTASGTSLTIPAVSLPQAYTLVANDQYVFVVFTATNVPTPAPSTSPTTAPTAGSPLPATSPTAAGFTPYEVASVLQFPVQNGYNGAGQTVVVLGDSVPATSDINTYLSANDITSAGANFTTVSINGGPGNNDSGGLLEATLDIETIAGLAPGATIEFYGLPDLTGASFTDAYTQLGSDTQATVMSASFGGCEYPGYSDTTQDPLLAASAGNGVVQFASAGDQGNECYGPPSTASPMPSYSPGANFPASDPYVVGVGGQENFPDAGNSSTAPSGTPTLTSTVAWNDYFFSGLQQGASGGGISGLFALPSYQSALSGAASTSFRNVPDIAMPAENVAVYLNGSWQTLGGTSWSAPLAAAMTADMNQACGGRIVSSGSNPVAQFYTAYSDAHSNFLDITSGNNQFAGTTPFYTAAAGYDNVTGLGVPYGTAVASSLCAPDASAAHRTRTMTHGIAAAPVDAYGEARDTSLGFVPHLGTDMGERGSAPVYVVVVMRATSTLGTDEQSVVSTLQAAGFTIDHRYANHMAIDATAPASVVERFFQTSIHNMNQGVHGMRYANVTPVVLPASIARVVHGAIVDNMVIARWFHHRIVPLREALRQKR